MNGYGNLIGWNTLRGKATGMSDYERLLAQRNAQAAAQAAAASDPFMQPQAAPVAAPAQGRGMGPGGGLGRGATTGWWFNPRGTLPNVQQGYRPPYNVPAPGSVPEGTGAPRMQPTGSLYNVNLVRQGQQQGLSQQMAGLQERERQQEAEYRQMLAQQAATRGSPTATDQARIYAEKLAGQQRMEESRAAGYTDSMGRLVQAKYAQGYAPPEIGFTPDQQGYTALNTYYGRLRYESEQAAKARGEAEAKAWAQMDSYASSQVGYFDSEYNDALREINARFSELNRYGSQEHQSALAALANEHNTRVRSFLSQTYGKYVR